MVVCLLKQAMALFCCSWLRLSSIYSFNLLKISAKSSLLESSSRSCKFCIPFLSFPCQLQQEMGPALKPILYLSSSMQRNIFSSVQSLTPSTPLEWNMVRMSPVSPVMVLVLVLVKKNLAPAGNLFLCYLVKRWKLEGTLNRYLLVSVVMQTVGTSCFRQFSISWITILMPIYSFINHNYPRIKQTQSNLHILQQLLTSITYFKATQYKLMYKRTLIVLSLLCLIAASALDLTPEEEKLKQHIKEVLDSHLVEGQKWGMNYHFYRPGLEKYGPDQWLWDSCFHMIAWSRLNVTNSILDLRTLLQKQVRKNGRIPEMIFWGPQSTGSILLNKLTLSDTSQTDISQMPMTPIALKRIYQQTNQSKAVLQEFLVRLIEYHGWWAHERQPDQDGLIVIIHPWESGLDASPMYDQALKVPRDQPQLKDLYYQFIQLELSYKYLYRWNQAKIIRKKNSAAKKSFLTYFVMKEVGVNAVYTYGWKILADLSRQYGNYNMAEYCMKEYNHFLKGLTSLFDQSKKRYVSHYLDGDRYKPTAKNTVQALFPIIVPDIPQAHKDSIIAMLKDDKHYHSDYPIPTVSRSDPAYNPVFTIDLMWRGPSWAAPNFFILQGLRNGNHTDLFKEIGSKWVNSAIKNGIWEMWNPQTGQGYGVKELGMSTSVVDIMFQLKQLGKL